MKNILKRRNKKGFTIVELVIVIGVIGILSAILIPTFVNVTDNANKAKTKANLANAYSAYAAQAADGVVDGTDHVIGFYSQENVGLSTASSVSANMVFYMYTEANGWATEAATTTKTPTLVTTVAEEAKFGGYYFYHLA